jgi:dihydropteroate synthase
MGVINVTPDSFSDGGKSSEPDHAAAIAHDMEIAGADIIDVGAESTRPRSIPVDAAEELARLIPAIRAIAKHVTIPISVDTYKAAVAAAALDEGAAIVNDISGLAYDSQLGIAAARRGAAVVLMHMRGRPVDMYQHAEYADVSGEIATELLQAVDRAVAAGIARESIILDPGLGFAKRAEHSLTALAHLERLAALGFPLLVGPSRKSFMTAATGPLPPDQRDWPTAAAVTAAVLAGAHLVRVHSVEKMVHVVRVADGIRKAAGQS